MEDSGERRPDAVAGLVVAGLLVGVMYALIASVNTRIDDLAGRFGKVDQRLLILERILLPPREPAGG